MVLSQITENFGSKFSSKIKMKSFIKNKHLKLLKFKNYVSNQEFKENIH